VEGVVVVRIVGEPSGGQFQFETIGAKSQVFAPQLSSHDPNPDRGSRSQPEPTFQSEPELDGQPARNLRIVLADDHRIMRQGLIMLLEEEPDLEVVGEAANGREAIELTRRHHPDVVVMDISMPVLNGIEATRQITAEMPGVRVIGLSMHETADMDQAMRDAGAAGYLAKGGPLDALVVAIREAAGGTTQDNK
jgi:CheY-like chemotaxis protein